MEQRNALTPLNLHKMAEDKKEVEVKQPKTEKFKIKREVVIDKPYKLGSEITLTKGKDDKLKETLIFNKFI